MGSLRVLRIEQEFDQFLSYKSPCVGISEIVPNTLYRELVENLRDSILRYEYLTTPLRVVEGPEERYTVVEGAHRLYALRQLGWPEAVCEVM
jgi:ParB-like chromosome segregation protein Spo0J